MSSVAQLAAADRRSLVRNTILHRRGEHPYGTREYLLLQKEPKKRVSAAEETSSTATTTSSMETKRKSKHKVLASLHAHRNVIFGARVRVEGWSIADACEELLGTALVDCFADGEQPQALAALHGLNQYVCDCRDGGVESETYRKLTQDVGPALEAVHAIATGIPRPGHSIVGQGTHREGAAAWEALAREFALQSDECQLYRNAHAQMVGIELLADTKPEYLASAGGAMARFFFLVDERTEVYRKKLY
jgi:hypothetical protein